MAGGLVVTDAAGRPTGLLQEQAQQLLAPLVLPYPVEQLVDAHLRVRIDRRDDDTRAVTLEPVGGDWAARVAGLS